MAKSNQDGPPRPHDGQQDRARGRVLDHLRGLGRRVRADQGRAEDARLGARPLAQRRRDRTQRDAADPRELDREAPRRAELRPDQTTRTRCRRMTSSTRSSRATSRRGWDARTSSPRASTRSPSISSRTSSTGPSGSAGRAPSARDQRDGVRPRPAAADHGPSYGWLRSRYGVFDAYSTRETADAAPLAARARTRTRVECRARQPRGSSSRAAAYAGRVAAQRRIETSRPRDLETPRPRA